jgi:SPP1 family predicted phage head-tail adaptor
VIQREGKKTLSTELKKRVQIQTKASVSDGEGGFTDTYTTSATVWAGISPIRATQQAEYKSINVDATHLVKLRGAVYVNELDRIVYGARIFEILTIENIQERGVLKLCTCLERR